MITFYSRTLVAGAAIAFAGLAHGQAPVSQQDDILVDEAGMTLYTFDKDEANSGASACYDKCAENWPPLEANADAKPEGDYTIIEREDGTRQWAYQGQPLYTFAKDVEAGTRAGDNVGGVWHVIKAE